jgi:acyl-CoA thioester hydrolase
MSDLIPTLRTAVNTWQRDENAHLNVQFYSSFAHDASAQLLNALGFGPRAQALAGARVSVMEDHIRYHREFRVVDTVEVHSAPLEVGERDLLAYHEVTNPADGTIAATVRRHVVSDQPWPGTFRKRAEAACVALPDIAKPRSVGTPLPRITLPEAPATGLVEVGRSMVKPEECDEKGEFLPRHYFGRYSDGAPFLWNHLGFDRAAMQERQEGSVVVEMRNEHHGALRAGDLAIVLSGLASFTDKILTFSHFLFEAETGTLVACAEAVGVKFDQKIRKIMRFTDEDRARLEQRKLQFA